jgi:hypothetical protein
MRARDRRGAILEKGAIREGCYTTRVVLLYSSSIELSTLDTILEKRVLFLGVGSVGVESVERYIGYSNRIVRSTY